MTTTPNGVELVGNGITNSKDRKGTTQAESLIYRSPERLSAGKIRTHAKDKKSEGPILFLIIDFGNRPFRPD